MTRRPTPHRAKVQFLKSIIAHKRHWLRRFAVVQVHRMASGGGTVHMGYRCNACETDWGLDSPERHHPECPCL